MLFNVRLGVLQTINMPLTDDALDALFEKLDLDESESIEYEYV